MKKLLSFALCSWTLFALVSAVAADSFPVKMTVDAGTPAGELRRFWRFFGADEPNYATMKDGRKLLKELGELAPDQVYFRAHNLLTSGDGTPALKWGSTGAYSEDATRRPVYDWSILDGIFDTYLQRGVRPYVEIGFMPEALSVKPEPYRHRWTPSARYEEIYTGWAYPPGDYSKWAGLAEAWARHCVSRYGAAEVKKWYWEVWNEPNIGYWRGTRQEFLKLHDYAVAGIRKALPTAFVGGADTAGSGGAFTRDFIEHCLRGTNYATGKVGTPLDFVSFHAKGAPRFVDGHVRMGIAEQLRTVQDGFQLIASYPELKGIPVVIGESDPDGCAACQGPQLGYRNSTMYASYTAACFARKHDLADQCGINLEGALTWAFEFEDQAYFAGFRALASNGIDLPVLNVFRMFSQMAVRRLPAASDSAVPLGATLQSGVRQRPDVSLLASVDPRKLTVICWHYHDDDIPGPEADVTLRLDHLPLINGKAREQHFRIDEYHSNGFAEWKRMGSPAQPSAEQYALLQKAASLGTLHPAQDILIQSGSAELRFALPRQAVSLVVLTW